LRDDGNAEGADWYARMAKALHDEAGERGENGA
jgi:hypothetical protein